MVIVFVNFNPSFEESWKRLKRSNFGVCVKVFKTGINLFFTKLDYAKALSINLVPRLL